MTTANLLNEIKNRLNGVYGNRLQGVVLYGSEARGQAGAESDIDVLVLLQEPVDYGRDLERNLEALYPLALEIGRRISAKPVSALEYETVDCPLYRSAHRDGIAAGENLHPSNGGGPGDPWILHGNWWRATPIPLLPAPIMRPFTR